MPIFTAVLVSERMIIYLVICKSGIFRPVNNNSYLASSFLAAATPYAVILDEVKNTVVITIRGTISMEDWVIDLQYVPQPLDKIGDICGFNGKNHHCHKGVLSRAKWLYNDLKKYRILKKLFAPDSPYKDHNLVVVGHSLVSSCTCSFAHNICPYLNT